MLRAEEAVTRNLLFLPDFDEKEKKLVLDATPDYKYYKYVLSAADPSDFWRERVVFEILEDTFDDDEFTENMEMSEAAALLGVTPEMVYREVQLRILHRKYRVTGGRIFGRVGLTMILVIPLSAWFCLC